LDGFVLWDRETESLWWPLIDEAVSGEMKGTRLKKYDQSKWLDTNLKYLEEQHPNAEVLKAGQTMEPPKNWRKYDSVNCK
jgi:hypothetical protein